MNYERGQAIKDQVEKWRSDDLRDLDDIVVVEYETDEEREAYSDECDRQGLEIKDLREPGPNGGTQIRISNDPKEYRKRNPL